MLLDNPLVLEDDEGPDQTSGSEVDVASQGTTSKRISDKH